MGNQVRFIFLILSVCLAEVAFSQGPPNYIVREYTTENGLPSNGIKGLQWDESTGLLWIATEAGIVRFNGLDFKSFTREGSSNFSSNRISFMVQNNKGQIRALDEKRQLFTVKKSRLEFLRKDVSVLNPSHIKFFGVAVSDKLIELDEKSNKYLLPFDKVFPINDTSCFIKNEISLIYYSISDDRKLILPVGSTDVRSAFRIAGDFFISDQLGQTYKVENNGTSFKPVNIVDGYGSLLKPSGIDDLVFGENGMTRAVLFNNRNAWILSFDGERINAELFAENILSDAMIRYVQYSEKQQTLFIGTDSKGLLVIKPKKVIVRKKQDRKIFEHNSYYAQVVLPNGNILTNEGHVIGNASGQQNQLPIQGTFAPVVLQMGDSVVWFSQPDKKKARYNLHQFNFKTGKSTVFEKFSMADYLTFAMSGNQLYIFAPDGIFRLFGDSIHKLLNVPNKHFTVARETSPGLIDLAGCDGLYRYDLGKNKLDTLFVNPGACIRSLWNYGDYIFFGTYGKGYYIYHNGVVKQMPLDRNNYLLFTHCFMPDGNGFCWISTNRGLFKVSIQQMITAFDQNIGDIYYHYLGRDDGMDMTELNGGCSPCAIQLQNGLLSFPTMDGLLQLEPNSTSFSLPQSDIYIDDIRVENRYIDPDSISLKPLPANTEEIVFELGYSAWSNKENIYIEYQMDDTIHWRKLPITNTGIIRIVNLSPGKHVLRVRKVNGFGTDNYAHLMIPFSIEKKWYKEWWFFTLQIIVVIALILLFTQFRTRHLRRNAERLERLVTEKTQELQQQNEVLEKNNSIKTRLISIISHDIITPLKFLTAAGRNLLDKKDQIPDDLQEETIREMTNTSQELQSLSMNILNWIKYQNENRLLMKENVNISELTSQVINILKSLAKRKNLELINDTDEQLRVYTFYEPLKILIYNLVSNSISFSEKGAITISTRETDHGVSIIVKDEGIGMKEEQIRQLLAEQIVITSANVDNKRGHGLGFMIIKDLLKMMGASISIDSKPGKGAAISIHLNSKEKGTNTG